MPRDALDAGLDAIWAAMRGCIDRGLAQEGIMPGGLNVRRRARQLHDKLQEQWRQNRPNPLLANDWLSSMPWRSTRKMPPAAASSPRRPMARPASSRPCCATSCTSTPRPTSASIRDFLLTAAAIGGIIKHNASISGAEVGCQGEVGSASAMAAAASAP